MKKLFASIGFVAAGAATVHAVDWLGTGDDKIWNVQATLRGFYDDNYLTLPHKEGSVGFEVSPQFSLNLPLQQTEIGVRYTYGLYYYQKREDNGQNPIDQTHQFDLWIDHAFDPRWDLRLEDSVTEAQDPDLTLTAAGTATPQRLTGNYVVNSANISLSTDWTEKFSTVASYANSFYFYENSGPQLFPFPPFVNPSDAGLLNRVEQTIGLEGQWHFSETTTGLVGYNFGLANYTGNEIIAFNPVTGNPYYSDSRDNYSHYVYVGVQHQFLENLSGSAKAGVQYTKYYNSSDSTSSLGPYADLSLIYTYMPGGYAQVGFTESRNATDTVNVNSDGQITQDQESSVLYGSINYPFTQKIVGSIVGHYQHSIYNGGAFNNETADFYNLGLNLSYAFNRHFSSEIGYNLDYYSTAVPGQTYSRNRIYLGVTASY